MTWRFWKMRNKVVVVGYSPEMIGGVTAVTNVMMVSLPYLELHAALRGHRPRWKSLAFSLYSVAAFLARLVFAAPRVVQVIVGSRGDAVRILPYIAFAKLRGCKVCLHFHKNREAIFGGMPPVVGRLVLAIWKRPDGYCFLSNRLRDEYRGRFDPRKPCVVISNPIAAQWLRPEVLPRASRTRGPVFLGRWCAEKGIDELLAAMKKLGAGSGEQGARGPGSPPHAPCQIYADHCPPVNPPNCDCHPWVPEETVLCILREASLVLLPSHAEALPTILLEAAACGTPFVASNVAGIPDIAEQSQAGLLHEVGDVETMRKAIERLLTDDALWEACSRTAAAGSRRWRFRKLSRSGRAFMGSSAWRRMPRATRRARRTAKATRAAPRREACEMFRTPFPAVQDYAAIAVNESRP